MQKGFAIIYVLILLTLLIGGIIGYYFSVSRKEENLNNDIISQYIPNELNPKTGNLYEDIKVQLQKEFK